MIKHTCIHQTKPKKGKKKPTMRQLVLRIWKQANLWHILTLKIVLMFQKDNEGIWPVLFTCILSHFKDLLTCEAIYCLIADAVGKSVLMPSSNAVPPLAAANGSSLASVKVNTKRRSGETSEYLFQRSITEEVSVNYFTLVSQFDAV